MLSCQRVFFVAAIFAILYIPLAYHSSQHVPPLTPRVNAAEGEKGKEKAKPKIEVVVDEFDPPSSYILEVKEDGRYVDPRKYSSSSVRSSRNSRKAIPTGSIPGITGRPAASDRSCFTWSASRIRNDGAPWTRSRSGSHLFHVCFDELSMARMLEGVLRFLQSLHSKGGVP